MRNEEENGLDGKKETENEKPETSDIRWPDVPPVYFKGASMAIIISGIVITIWGLKVIFLCSC